MRLRHRLLICALLFAGGSAYPLAQATPTVTQTLTPADTGRWESLVVSDSHLGFSPDGAVLAYRIDRSDWDDELRVLRRADGRTLVIPLGRDPEYSADGRWLRYTIGHAQSGRSRSSSRDGLGLLRLDTWTETRVDDVESAAFSGDGAFIAIEHGAARAAGGRGGSARRTNEAPLVLTVRALDSGTETSFENVQQFVWQPHGHRLALAMGGDNQGSARLQLVDAAGSGAAATSVLDDTAATYSRLAWRDDGRDLAYARVHPARGAAAPVVDIVVARGAGLGQRALTVTGSDSLPNGTRLSTARPLAWSADGAFVFAGLADGAETPAASRADESRVRIWHWTDVKVMPRQVLDADKDRRRSRIGAVVVDEHRVVPLTLTLDAAMTALGATGRVLVTDWHANALAHTLGRPSAELAIVDVRTGTRHVVAPDVDDHDVHVGPDGGAALFIRGSRLFAVDTATHATTDLSTINGAAWLDTASDETGPHPPLFGIGGWTTDGAALLYDAHDVWRVPISGTNARRLTDGAAAGLRYRIANLTDEDDDAVVVDLAAPLYLEVFGLRTKQYGYATLTNGVVSTRVLADRRIDHLTVTSDGRTYAYIDQDFDRSPDIYVATAALTDGRAVTHTNPQRTQFAWGRSRVLAFTTARGLSLDAALYYPANYVPGRRYPMIVTVYEGLSSEVHDFETPSDMEEANIAVFTQLGYAVLAPDIRYRPRDPGVSTVDCVTAAVSAAVEMGVADAARVGVIGHSWGAYDSAFLATHTRGVFAAAVAGSPITDLISQYGNHHWGTGVAETDHIETGQQRMQVPLYDDPDAYVRNSPIFGAGTMTTPLLLEAGDEDGDVFWHQSVELYNVARRAGKPVVLLQYPGEDHALDDFDHRRDYQRRILEWFGHYLKSETASPWITTGTPFVKK